MTPGCNSDNIGRYLLQVIRANCHALDTWHYVPSPGGPVRGLNVIKGIISIALLLQYLPPGGNDCAYRGSMPGSPSLQQEVCPYHENSVLMPTL